MPTQDPPSDEIDTIAYAVSFLDAARLVGGDGRFRDNAPMVVPFYMLIGFSLENGLKAALEYSESLNRKWSHSHDLTYLRKLAEDQSLKFRAEAAEFIDCLSPLHQEHHFRYPQKAAIAELHQPGYAIEMTNGILSLIFMFVEGPSRISAQ